MALKCATTRMGVVLLHASLMTGPPGSLPPMSAGIVLSRQGVLVTAFGRNPDGAGTLLRVWEQTGAGGTLKVTLPKGSRFATAQVVNLLTIVPGDHTNGASAHTLFRSPRPPPLPSRSSERPPAARG